MFESGFKKYPASYRKDLDGTVPGKGKTEKKNTVPNPVIANLLLNQTLHRMEYFRTRCLEMEEKYGSNLSGLREKIENGENEMTEGWDELVRWEDYSHSFEEWKHKYEALNNYL